MRVRLCLLAAMVVLPALLSVPASAMARIGYTADVLSSSVTGFDTTTNQPVSSLSFPGSGGEPSGLTGVAISPNGSRAYLTYKTGNKLVVLDTATKKVLATLDTGVGPIVVAVSPNGDRVITANLGGFGQPPSNTATVINATNNTVIATVVLGPPGIAPWDVAFTPDGSRAYIPNQASLDGGTGCSASDTYRVSEINPATATVTNLDFPGNIVCGTGKIAITPDGKRAYMSTRDGLVVLDTDPSSPTYHTVIARPPLPAGEGYIAITPDPGDPTPDSDNARAYIVDKDTNTIKVVDVDPTHPLTYNTVLQSIPLPPQPVWSTCCAPANIAIAPNGERAYFLLFNNPTHDPDPAPPHDQIGVVDTNPASPTYNTLLPATIDTTPMRGDPVGIAVTPDSNEVWFSAPAYDPGGSSTDKHGVVIIDTNPSSFTYNEIKEVVPGSEPGKPPGAPIWVAITPDGQTGYANLFGTNQIAAVDLSAMKVTATIDVGMTPFVGAMSPNGKRLYVAGMGSGTVSMIDTTSNTVAATISGLTEVMGIAVSPDGQRLYVADSGAGEIRVVDTSDYRTIKTISVGGGPALAAVTPDGRKLYVTNKDTDSVDVIDTSQNTVAATIGGFANNPIGVAISPDGTTAYVTNQAATSPDSKTARATDAAANTISVIDTATDTVTTSFSTVTAPGPITVAPDGKTAYVASTEGVLSPGSPHSEITLVDLQTKTTTPTTVDTGDGPVGIAITPNQGPTANFGVTSTGTAGLPTTFDGSSSSDPDGSVARYDWDFGDGTSLRDGGPNPSHTYTSSGRYTATVTTTDNEGCSTDFVFTGQTAYCNGSTLARKSTEIAISNACSFSLASPYVSVSHWKAVDGHLRGRLKAYPGGYLLRTNTRSVFALQVRGILGKTDRALDKVVFYLDGQRTASDRKAPYIASADPASFSNGTHELKATIFSRKGGKRTLSLKFFVSTCEDAAFSAGMSSKARRAHPNLDLRARSGGAALESVRFTLPRQLRLRAKGLAAGNIGLVRLRRESGARSTQALRLKKRSGTTLELAAGAHMSARLSLRGTRSFLALGGLKGENVTAVDVRIKGKRTRMVKNPDSCAPKLKFGAALTSTEGKTVELNRSLQMCKGLRR